MQNVRLKLFASAIFLSICGLYMFVSKTNLFSSTTLTYRSTYYTEQNSSYFAYDHTQHFLQQGMVYLRQLRLPSDQATTFAKSKRIVLCASVRNSQDAVYESSRVLEQFGSYFKAYKVLVVENDSNDATRKRLLEWSRRNANVRILGCGVNADNCTLAHLFKTDILPGASHRPTFDIAHKATHKMAVIRNIYLDYALADPELSTYDYMGVYEMDNWARISWDAFPRLVSTLRAPFVDAVCGMEVHNGDVNALRDACTFVVPPIPMRHRYTPVNPHFHYYVSHTLMQARADRLLRVQSCYQAFAMYRVDALRRRAARYRASPPGLYTCEHNELAYQLQNMYIDKQFVLRVYRYSR